jgi:hypothetical protein
MPALHGPSVRTSPATSSTTRVSAAEVSPKRIAWISPASADRPAASIASAAARPIFSCEITTLTLFNAATGRPQS